MADLGRHSSYVVGLLRIIFNQVHVLADRYQSIDFVYCYHVGLPLKCFAECVVYLHHGLYA